MILGVFVFVIQSNRVQSYAAPKLEISMDETSCSFAREYITSFEYLRSQKQLLLSELEGKKLALQVTAGCNGAAERFIKVVSVMTKSGLSARDAVKLGTEFARRTTQETETFLAVFQKGFLAEYLDMDLRDSLRLAKSLSTDFKGDISAVRKDFEKMVDFCSGKNPEGIELSLPRCGDFAARIARLGEKLNGGVAEPFQKMFEFLTNSITGPGLTKSQSLGLAQKVLESGGTGVDNFILAYRYAISQSGLSMDIKNALEFAKKLSIDLPLEVAKEGPAKS